MFAYHLLPPDLQMYILSKRSDLLLLAPRLSKFFYQRAQPYLYQEFYYKSITYLEVLTRSITHWTYVDHSFYFHRARINERVLVNKTFKRRCLYILEPNDYLPSRYYIYRPTPRFVNDYDNQSWPIDFITAEQVLLKRTFCSRRDPNYVKNYLLNYLSQFRSNCSNKMYFYLYLILNLRIYGHKLGFPTEVNNLDLDSEIEKLYPILVNYLQKK